MASYQITPSIHKCSLPDIDFSQTAKQQRPKHATPFHTQTNRNNPCLLNPALTTSCPHNLALVRTTLPAKQLSVRRNPTGPTQQSPFSPFAFCLSPSPSDLPPPRPIEYGESSNTEPSQARQAPVAGFWCQSWFGPGLVLVVVDRHDRSSRGVHVRSHHTSHITHHTSYRSQTPGSL